MRENLVTVCINTYNRSDLLFLTVESVLKQTYENLEILIIDDFSTDSTQEVAESLVLRDDRIKYIRHDINKGLAVARNTAINNANGKYFTFIDDDDLWEPNYISEFVNLAEGYTYDRCFCCGYKDIRKNIDYVLELDDSLKNIIYNGYTPPVAAQFYFTKSLKDVNGYNEQIKSGVDHDLWIRLAIKGYKIKSLNKALALPNHNDSNNQRMSTNFDKRVSGIKDSLNLWEKDIVECFGPEFYKHFRDCYFYHIYKKLFFTALLSNDYLKAFSIMLNIPFKQRLILEIILIIKRKLNSNKRLKVNSSKSLVCIIKPSFIPFKNKLKTML